MSAIRALERMLAAGVPLETAMELAKQFEADVTEYVASLAREMSRAVTPETAEDKRQARNRRYYESKQRLKASENKTDKTLSDGSDASKTVSDAALTCAREVKPTSSLRSEDTSEAIASSVSASTPADPEKPKTKPPKANRGTRLPDDWEPSEADVEVARSEGLTDEEIRRAAVEFRNFWCARSRDATKLSWPKTWHNRVIELADRKRRNSARLAASAAKPGGGGRGAVSFADIYARRHGYAAD